MQSSVMELPTQQVIDVDGPVVLNINGEDTMKG